VRLSVPPAPRFPPLQHVLVVVPVHFVTVATAAVPFLIRLQVGRIGIDSSGPVARPLGAGLLGAHEGNLHVPVDEDHHFTRLLAFW